MDDYRERELRVRHAPRRSFSFFLRNPTRSHDLLGCGRSWRQFSIYYRLARLYMRSRMYILTDARMCKDGIASSQQPTASKSVDCTGEASNGKSHAHICFAPSYYSRSTHNFHVQTFLTLETLSFIFATSYLPWRRDRRGIFLLTCMHDARRKLKQKKMIGTKIKNWHFRLRRTSGEKIKFCVRWASIFGNWQFNSENRQKFKVIRWFRSVTANLRFF